MPLELALANVAAWIVQAGVLALAAAALSRLAPVEQPNLRLAFEQAPTDMDYLWREARLRDPDGHQLRLYWAGDNRLNPPWRIP